MRKRILSSLTCAAAVGTLALGGATLASASASAATTAVFTACTSGGYYGYISPGVYEGANMGGCTLESGTPAVNGSAEFTAAGSEYLCSQITALSENSDGTYNVSAGPCKGSNH
jgi:hypothetical protein